MPATARQTASNHASMRSRMLAAFNIQWKQLRPDLLPDELRDERIAFINDQLRLKSSITSMRELSDRQLGLALDALKRFQAQPLLPNSEAVAFAPARHEATVIHLATDEQKHAIEKLFNYLGWHEETRARYLLDRYQRDKVMFLTPKQARSLMMILFNIACARDLKARGVKTVSRPMMRRELPELQKRLGINQKRTEKQR